MDLKVNAPAEGRWFLPLGLSWLLFNLFDLGITFWALATGSAVEANPLMRPLVAVPLLATPVKLGLAFLALKLAERIQYRTQYSSFPVLVAMNLHIVLVCVNNVLQVLGSPHADHFQFLNPLGM